MSAVDCILAEQRTPYTCVIARVWLTSNSLQWAALGDKITARFIPQWAQDLPDYVAKLQREMNMARGSLAEEIWQEAQDQDIHPEIALSARVRIGKDLCSDEIAFVRRRKRYTALALAKYLDIAEADVDPEDVPTIAVCGSGGGLRALVAGAASYLSVEKNPIIAWNNARLTI